MATVYRINAEQVPLKKRLARVGAAAAIAALAFFIFHFFSHSRNTNYEDLAVDEIGVIFAAGFFDSGRSAYDIEVTSDSIQTRGGWGRSHRVRRGRIAYLSEAKESLFHEAPLYLSEHRGAFRFWFGYVSIPASLPEYEQLKTLATTWTNIG